jgi:hypothetical protein
MNNGKNKIVEEHFWFTAITVGFNAFVIEKMSTDAKGVFYAVTLVNFYAIFLILHRAAAHAGKIKYPKSIAQMDETEKRFYHKGIETLCHFRAAILTVSTRPSSHNL